MKQKIKEALQQEYKNLGLNEEAFEGVAAFGETFGVNEETLANFVKGAKDFLKKMQSDADKVRNVTATNAKQVEDLRAKLAEAEAKLKTKGEGGDGNKDADLAKLLEDKLSALVQPLKEELANIKNARNAEDAFKFAKDYFFSLDYGKKYPDERDEAWERAVEINEATGKKMTAEELQSKAIGYLNKYSAKRGVSDSTKPLPSEGGAGDLDFAEDKAILVKDGLLKENK